MKKIISFLLFCLMLKQAAAQITTPVIKARFGVDADLRSNFFDGLLQNGNDDWFSNIFNASTTGNFIIDTTGASLIVSRYFSVPASRMQPFFRGMRYPQFSIRGGKMLIDAIFIRDHHGDDSTVFAAGSNKNGMSPAMWSTPISQGIPDKNDILDMFMHVRRDGENNNDSLWLFGGISIAGTTGNRYFDFEMYQTDIVYNKPAQAFYGYGPDAGHTSWQFDAAGNVTKAGDIIFSAEYSSSSLSFLEARIWVHQSALLITPGAFNWGGSFEGDGAGAVYGYANISPKTTGAFYTGLQSVNNTWAGPFALVLQDNSVVANYSARQFMEFSVNLSKLGLDPLITVNDPCAMPFRRILVKSRASTSFTAELKDFVGPFSFFRAPRAELTTNFPVICNNGIADIWVNNSLLTSLYTWYTPNGNIVTDTVGPSITVDAPGTYIVRQELMDSCGSTYAMDTVVITLNPTCEVLPGKPYDFTASLAGDLVNLEWKGAGYDANDRYEIERSEDGRHFTVAKEVAAKKTANYAEQDDVSKIESAELFYRIQYKGRDGRIVYTNTVRLLLPNKKTILKLMNNPVAGDVHFRFSTAVPANVLIQIVNTAGAILFSKTVHTIAGNNNLRIARSETNLSPGHYLLQVKMPGTTLSEQLVVVQ